MSCLSSRIKKISVSENDNDRERVEQQLHYTTPNKKCIEINKQSSNKYTIGCGSFESGTQLYSEDKIFLKENKRRK